MEQLQRGLIRKENKKGHPTLSEVEDCPLNGQALIRLVLVLLNNSFQLMDSTFFSITPDKTAPRSLYTATCWSAEQKREQKQENATAGQATHNHIYLAEILLTLRCPPNRIMLFPF